MRALNSLENFGAIDADHDDILLKCFEDHESYQTLLERKKFIIIGRKGAGKTSIFKKIIAERHHDFFSFGHTFNDYPWSHHNTQAQHGVPEQFRYMESWKYLICLTLAKVVLNYDQSLPINDLGLENLTSIERFVVDSYGSRDPDLSQVFSPGRKLRLKPYFKLDFSVLQAGISPESVPINELPKFFREINDTLSKQIIGALNPKHSYYICFDELDLGFEPGNVDYESRLKGLILATREINRLAKKMGQPILVANFLREDIYDRLDWEDKNKVTENDLSLIEWDTKRTSRTLKGLMERRFTELLHDSQSKPVSWDDVFDETEEMTGHQSKYQHLLDRTFLRPRDMIKFCNVILEKYIQRTKKSPGSLKFSNEDIYEARSLYSEYFMKELSDEIHKHVPNYRRYFDLLRSLGVGQFEKSEFIKVLDEKKSSLGLVENTDQILRYLYKFSVVGYQRIGGRGGGSEYVFRYLEGADFDDSATKFRVHLGLHDNLNLKRFARGES